MRISTALATLLAATLAAAVTTSAPPASAREVSGRLAYTMRIALPPDTQVLIELASPSGPVATLRQRTRGAQVPLPFALTDAGGDALTLRAALFIDGRPLWTSDPYPVAAGTADIDLGTLRLDPFIALGFATRLDCDGQTVEVGFHDRTARLRASGATYVLTEAPANRGRRYTDARTPETSLRAEADKIAITLQGRSLPDCLPAIPANLLPLRASGTEPFWSLTATRNGLKLQSPDAPDLETPLPPVDTTADGIEFRNDGLTLGLQDRLCHDAMTGMPYPLTATVRTVDRTLSGCAGLPATLLDGDWQVATLDGKSLRGGAKITLSFRNGIISGLAACNRFNGRLTLTAEGLSIGPLAATRMACPPVLMQAETATFAALAATTGFDIDPDGQLLLLGPSGPLLIAGR